MRLWTLHPKYLDTKGLVALWREALLAKKVLEGKTKGYKNHPQLDRFKNYEHPLTAINYYLHKVWVESQARKFNFRYDIIDSFSTICEAAITTTHGQVLYEYNRLTMKLRRRKSVGRVLFVENDCLVCEIETHPLFKTVRGAIEPWEKKH